MIITFNEGVRQSVLISPSGLSVLALSGLTIIAKQIIAAAHFSLCGVKASRGKRLMTNLLLPCPPPLVEGCWSISPGRLVTVKEQSGVAAGGSGLNGGI